MRVNLKGIHSATARLANGERVKYYYAWKGGPRLKGEPGSPEFLASFEAARRARRDPTAGTFHAIICGFKSSPDFTRLRDRTREDYSKQIKRIEVAFGDLPVDALLDARVTKDFLDWRDKLAASPRQADYAWTVLMRIISWARARGLTSYRPPERVERLYHADRSEAIWSEADIAAFMGVAPEPLQRALMLALETGQRQGDLLVLPWSAWDGGFIKLKQSKTGRKVEIPATRRLRAVLDGIPRNSPVILTNKLGRPWQGNSFRKAWGAATRKAGITGLTFHDIRGTAVTRLSEAGCTPQEIATITGHSLRDVAAILDKYLSRTKTIAVAAIAKLERGRK
jgi:integrase